MKKRTVEVVMMAAMAVAISGCVAVRDSIPIMGENTDGTKVIVANATRTRLYALSKAAEKIELWQVSSDKGVAMKGSDSSSDGTAIIAALERGLELGAQVAASRLGASTTPQLVTTVAPSSPAGAVPEGYTFAAATTGAASAVSATVPATISGDGISVVVLGNRSTCGYCQSLWGGLDVAALSAALCGANVIDADAQAAPETYAKLRPQGAFSYPLVLVYEAGQLKGQFSGRGLTQATLTEKVKSLTTCK